MSEYLVLDTRALMNTITIKESGLMLQFRFAFPPPSL